MELRSIGEGGGIDHSTTTQQPGYSGLTMAPTPAAEWRPNSWQELTAATVMGPHLLGMGGHIWAQGPWFATFPRLPRGFSPKVARVLRREPKDGRDEEVR